MIGSQALASVVAVLAEKPPAGIRPWLIRGATALALAYAIGLQRKAIDAAADRTLRWATSKRKGAPPAAPRSAKEEALATITGTLIRAGWNAEDAGREAEALWARRPASSTESPD
jgi:hypothetical protein